METAIKTASNHVYFVSQEEVINIICAISRTELSYAKSFHSSLSLHFSILLLHTSAQTAGWASVLCKLANHSPIAKMLINVRYIKRAAFFREIPKKTSKKAAI